MHFKHTFAVTSDSGMHLCTLTKSWRQYPRSKPYLGLLLAEVLLQVQRMPAGQKRPTGCPAHQTVFSLCGTYKSQGESLQPNVISNTCTCICILLYREWGIFWHVFMCPACKNLHPRNLLHVPSYSYSTSRSSKFQEQRTGVRTMYHSQRIDSIVVAISATHVRCDFMYTHSRKSRKSLTEVLRKVYAHKNHPDLQ